ncbi:hypothetical protein [Streptomyces sp. NPDC020917]|uniref:hypothetical protein n=1 Tax=Streptomyces sp. NPDC020917 TaxID=3365102 RepID=UPI0037AECCE5
MTTGSDAHPEVSEISDFTEGLLRPERSCEVQAHLDDCDLCGDVLRSLEEIRGMLGTLPGPQRMPADIAGRIDAALAAEALLDATLPHVPRETSVGGSTASARTNGVPRETSTAPHGRPGGSAGPGRGGRSGDRRAAWRRGGFLAVAAAAGIALLSGVIYAIASGTGEQKNAASSAQRSGTVAGAQDTVGTQVRQLLDEAGAGGSTKHPSGTDQGTTPMLQPNNTGAPVAPKASPAALPSCVIKATHRSQPPLAAERENFHGTDAYLVVLPHPNDSSQVDAFVVNASCTPASPGAVLFQGTYPR